MTYGSYMKVSIVIVVDRGRLPYESLYEHAVPIAWRVRQVPFCGLLNSCGFHRSLEPTSIQTLVKHAISK